ncbi:hypothetical protein ACLI08_05130 [Flavobacterium sp. RNTU_13]|uniref:hypothetical protein n=1 Tax=Flavobacterium sp. RNTU_13 TaxID=3375145 RepID=UPI003986E4E2
MKQAVILFTLSIISFTKAQTIGQNYKRLTNLAELSITEARYYDALREYNEAFEIANFSVDLYNAAACAAKLNDTKMVYSYSRKLAEKGVGEKFFRKKIFSPYKNDPAFIKIMKLAEQTKQKNMKVNGTYNKQIQEFVTLDSTYNRLRLTKYRELGHTPDTLENLFRTNTQNIMAFIKVNGVYSEEKMGARISNDTIIRYMSKGDIVLLHYLEMGRDRQLINEIKALFISNLSNGTITHYNVSQIMEMTDTVFGDTGMWLFKISLCKLYRKKEIEQLAEINQTRRKCFLENITDLEKKLIFKYGTRNNFDFRYNITPSPVYDKEFFYSAFEEVVALHDCN